MIRGTTPDYILNVNADLTGKTVYVTIKQKRNVLTLTNDDLTIAVSNGASSIAFSLTQKQTLQFDEGRAEVQVKYIGSDNKTKGTNVAAIMVDRALLEEEVAYVADD